MLHFSGFLQLNLKIINQHFNHHKTSCVSTCDRRLKASSAIQRLAFPRKSSSVFHKLTNSSKTNELSARSEMKAFVLFWKFLKPDIFQLLIGSFGSVILGIIFPMFFYLFCEIIGAMANLEDDVVYHRTTFIVIIYVGLGSTTLVGTYLQTLMIGKVTVRTANRLRRILFAAFLEKSAAEFDEAMVMKRKFQTLISKRVTVVETAIRNFFGPGLQILVAVVSSLPIALSVQWSQALFLYFITPILFLAYYAYYYFVQVKVSQPSETIIFEHRPRSVLTRKMVADAGLNGLFCAIREIAFGAILIYGGELIVHNGVSNKDILQVNLVIINVALQIGQIVSAFADFQKGLKVMKEIGGFIFSNQQPMNNLHFTLPDNVQIQSIEFVDVFLSKNQQKRESNLNAKPGDTHTLICNMTENNKDLNEITKTLLGLKKLSEGQILISGISLDLIPLVWLRQLFASTNEFFRFFPNRSIIDNLSYGSPCVEVQTIMKYLAQVQMQTIFEAFPQGYDTDFGAISNHLSVTEMRKLHFIRCILRNSPVLILDNDCMKFENFIPDLKNKVILLVTDSQNQQKL